MFIDSGVHLAEQVFSMCIRISFAYLCHYINLICMFVPVRQSHLHIRAFFCKSHYYSFVDSLFITPHISIGSVQ